MSDEEIRLETIKLTIQLFANNRMSVNALSENIKIIYNYIKHGTSPNEYKKNN